MNPFLFNNSPKGNHYSDLCPYILVSPDSELHGILHEYVLIFGFFHSTLCLFKSFMSLCVLVINFNCCRVFHCMNIAQLFIYSPDDGLLGCFQFLVFMNQAAMNFFVMSSKEQMPYLSSVYT